MISLKTLRSKKHGIERIFHPLDEAPPITIILAQSGEARYNGSAGGGRVRGKGIKASESDFPFT
jgi:hypothetical protein